VTRDVAPFAVAFALLACQSGPAPRVSAPAAAPPPLEFSLAGPEAAKTPKPAACEPGELLWKPALCRFAACVAGQFETPRGWLADCARPLNTQVRFEPSDATLSVNARGSLENLAVMAEALGVLSLTVTGHQSWDEKPDSKAPVPLSRERANAVRDALQAVTKIAIEVVDGGTRERRYVTGEEFEHKAMVSMTPLDDALKSRELPPFKLPWTLCQSEVKFTTEISISTKDGQILAEICRNGACSRTDIPATQLAVWPGGMGATMKGDFEGNLTMEPTEAQMMRNTEETLGKGTGPASFNLEVSFEDERISPNDTFRLRLLRNRKDVALDWSGKLELQATKRHATQAVPPCLKATLAIPQSQHGLR
jgi:outer membrane protein OmpA-like peptidoglycan-associated protein